MRYLPLTDADRSQMLAATGSKSMEDIYCDVPAEALLAKTIDLPPHQGEMEVERAISAMAAKNLNTASLKNFRREKKTPKKKTPTKKTPNQNKKKFLEPFLLKQALECLLNE